MGKHVLLVAATTGYQTRMFEETADRLGYAITLGIDRCIHLPGSWGERAVPLRFEEPAAAAAVLADCRQKPDGIVALGDRPTEIAALTAQALGLPFHSPDAVLACRNKFTARERFRGAGLRTPEYFVMPSNIEAPEAARSARYPCVVKPLGLSGSRGVIRADHEWDFCAAVERIRTLLALPEIRRTRESQNDYLLAESYIPGCEFALEGIVTNSVLRVLAIFDKPDPLEGPFFEETIYVTPSRAPVAVLSALEEATALGIRALGLSHGPIHAEMRWNEEGVWLLEIAARPIGGLCAGSLRFGDNVSLEELILRHAAGEDVDGLFREDAASGVMMIPIPASGVYRGASGLEDARSIDHVENVILSAQPGQRLRKLPEGASYLGFIFARGATPETVERSLRQAHEKLTFDIAEELPLAPAS